MFTEILLILASLVFLVVSVITYKRQNEDLPPGPFQWPFIGNLRLLKKLSRQYRGQHNAFLELSKRYSSNLVSLRLGRSNVIAVSGYKELQTIFSGEEFDGRPWNEFAKLRNMGLKKGITMSDGPEWKQVRAWLVRSLRQIGFGRVERSACMHKELQIILDKMNDGGIVCMRSLLTPIIVNVIWTLVSGKRIPDGKKFQNFMALMERRAEAFDMAGGILTIFPWIRHIAPVASGYSILRKLNIELKSFLMDEIEDHKKNYAPGRNGCNIINMFLDEMYNGKKNNAIFDEDQLFVILLDLLIAGSVTTTTTLDFLFLRMAAHQDIQRRVHEELDNVIGRERLPELNDRQNLPYVEAVLTESQRMQMVVPIIGPRRALRDTNVGCYRIPKDTCLLLNLWSVNMSQEYFPNPDSFQPERFLKNGSFFPDEKLIFFGRGHRRCPAEADAKSTMFIFFVGIMQRFQLLPKPGQKSPDIEPKPGLTLSPKPYEIFLVPRKRIDTSGK